MERKSNLNKKIKWKPYVADEPKIKVLNMWDSKLKSYKKYKSDKIRPTAGNLLLQVKAKNTQT